MKGTAVEVDALLFDLDGTLLDTVRDIALSLNHTLARYGRPSLAEDHVARCIGDGVQALLGRALGLLPVSQGTVRIERALADANVYELPATLDGMDLAQVLREFRSHYVENCMNHTRPYPGVLRVLDHFSSKKLGVVTNKPLASSERVLAGLGLRERFGVLFAGDSTPEKKPSPLMIHRALDDLGVAAGRAIVIGDSANDVLAGRAAGCATCGVTYGIGDQEALAASAPDFLVDSMEEILDLVR